MSDSNIQEKMIESITNIMKKTIIFEKTERMKGLFIGLVISSSVFGLFTMYNAFQLSNMDQKINDIDDNMSSIENIVKENAHMPRVYYKIFTECYDNLFKTKLQHIETNEKMESLNNRIDKIIALLEDKKVEKSKKDE
jgi:hypothetical protein